MMICTEGDAKTKRCPHAMAIFNAFTSGLNENRDRVHQPVHAATGYNRASDMQPETVELLCCLGSGCMMWSWIEPDQKDRLGTCGLIQQQLSAVITNPLPKLATQGNMAKARAAKAAKKDS